MKDSILSRLSNYPNLLKLFENRVPANPPLTVKVYRNPKIDQSWGQRFTFWNVILNDSDRQFNALLNLLDSLVAKHRAAYGEKRLRTGITNNPFSFLSELIIYDTLETNGIAREIEPSPAPQSENKLDFAIGIENRSILIEVIAPLPPERMISQGVGFAPLDADLSDKLAEEIVTHLKGIKKPKDPLVIMVDGVYSGLDPINAETSIVYLNNRSPSLATFVSAVLLFRRQWGTSFNTNLTGVQLTENEIWTLKSIFHIPT